MMITTSDLAEKLITLGKSGYRKWALSMGFQKGDIAKFIGSAELYLELKR